MNAGSRYQVSIGADPNLPIIRMTRDFDATPTQLMRAHIDPELFARWVGPNGMETKILDWDATTGGRWRYVAGRDGEVLVAAVKVDRDQVGGHGDAPHEDAGTGQLSQAICQCRRRRTRGRLLVVVTAACRQDGEREERWNHQTEHSLKRHRRLLRW